MLRMYDLEPSFPRWIQSMQESADNKNVITITYRAVKGGGADPAGRILLIWSFQRALRCLSTIVPWHSAAACLSLERKRQTRARVQRAATGGKPLRGNLPL